MAATWPWLMEVSVTFSYAETASQVFRGICLARAVQSRSVADGFLRWPVFTQGRAAA